MTSNQTEPFVPLCKVSPPRNERAEFQVTVFTQSDKAKSFRLLDSETSVTASGPAARHGKSCDPQVSIQREGDHVTGIRVQCGCGQVIDLACVYQEPEK